MTTTLMSAYRLLDRFVREASTPKTVALVDVEHDGEQWQRTLQRIEEAKESLGERYICHASKRIERRQ